MSRASRKQKRLLKAQQQSLNMQQQQANLQNQQNNIATGAGPQVIDTTTRGRGGGITSGTISTSNVSKWASDLMEQLAQMGFTGLQNNPLDFGPIAQQAREGFLQNTIPSIATRFSSLGTGGSQRSSAFPQLLSQAGANLETQLAALKSQYGLDAGRLNMGMLSEGLKPQWNTDYKARQPGFWENMGVGMLSSGMQAAAKYGTMGSNPAKAATELP
jgi:hypothetical protein